MMLHVKAIDRFIDDGARGTWDGPRRAGLTVLEFVGCLISIVGGVWLGAIYLGVDVRHLAHTALSETDLLERVPAGWRPPGPEENRMTREQLVETLREELGHLRTEIAGLQDHGHSVGDRIGSGESGGQPQSDADSTASSGVPSRTGSVSAAERLAKEKTLAYWLRVSDIALGEAALQQDAEAAFDQQQAAKVFAIKGRISRFAAKAVEAIPRDDVDDTVVQFGLQLRAWYEGGGELYDRAVQIWETPTNNPGRTQLNEEWRRSELHHRSEARLLNGKGAAIRLGVSRRFGEEFPPFAQQSARSTKEATAESTSVEGKPATTPNSSDGVR